jgi:hypothetical protein
MNKQTSWALEAIIFAVCCVFPPLFLVWIVRLIAGSLAVKKLKELEDEFFYESDEVIKQGRPVDETLVEVALIFSRLFDRAMPVETRQLVRDGIEKIANEKRRLRALSAASDGSTDPRDWLSI